MTTEVSLPAVPGSVRTARRTLADAARDLELPADALSIAELALSELVTNAVVHGASPIVLQIGGGEDQLRVAVLDSGPARPRADETRLDATGGRGLAIVAAVAGTWGVDPVPGDGKWVWFRVSL
jgi:anti-sigma regulatory factor (Ser/Thr protein kinase)